MLSIGDTIIVSADGSKTEKQKQKDKFVDIEKASETS